MVRWRARAAEPVAVATARAEATRLAGRVVALREELAANRAANDGLVAEQAPQLLDMVGVGPVVAATVLVAWSHPGAAIVGAEVDLAAGAAGLLLVGAGAVALRRRREHTQH